MENKNKEDLNLLILKSKDENNIVEKCLEMGYKVVIERTYESAIETFIKIKKIQVVIAALGIKEDGSDYWQPLVNKIRIIDQKVFIIIFSYTAVNDPFIRVKCFDEGCNMVTNSLESLGEVLNKISKIVSDKSNKINNLKCPICGYENLSEDGLWVHLPLYHINNSNKSISKIKNCPSCKNLPTPNLQVHYRNIHGPCGRGEIHNEDQKPVKLYAFALVVVHRKIDNKYLLVQEFGQSGYWLPGGRVDAGEDLKSAAIRETKEEAGIDINIKGILTFQFNHSHGRLRIIFYAEPIDDNQLPKSIPDYESVGASYVSPNQISQLPLRGDEPLIWIDYVEKGNTIFPISIMSNE